MVSMKCIVLLAVGCALVSLVSGTDQVPGGLSEERPADREIQRFVNKVRGAVEAKTKLEFEKFKAVRYRTQIVNGLVFYVKVQIAEENAIHLKIHKDVKLLGSSPKLLAVATDKTMDDEITSFN